MKLFIIIFTLNLFSQNQGDVNQYKKLLDQALKMQEQNSLSTGNIDMRIERISGSVSIITSYDEDVLINDNYQYPLEPGDVIKTGYDGYANVYINNIGVIRIERNSEFEISDPSNDMIFTLSIGSIVSKMENLLKHGLSVKVKTPSAVLAVRGTEFALEYSKFGNETNAGVFDEGEINLYPGENEDENQIIKIAKNMEVSISPSSKRARVVKMSKLLKYKRGINEAKKHFILHKKKWKRFDNAQKNKFREILFNKKSTQDKKKVKIQKNHTQNKFKK